jgi:hypothetical protein
MTNTACRSVPLAPSRTCPSRHTRHTTHDTRTRTRHTNPFWFSCRTACFYCSGCGKSIHGEIFVAMNKVCTSACHVNTWLARGNELTPRAARRARRPWCRTGTRAASRAPCAGCPSSTPSMQDRTADPTAPFTFARRDPSPPKLPTSHPQSYMSLTVPTCTAPLLCIFTLRCVLCVSCGRPTKYPRKVRESQ